MSLRRAVWVVTQLKWADWAVSEILYPDVPPRVEYSVTDFGKTLLPHVEALIKWGQDNFEQIMHNRHKNI